MVELECRIDRRIAVVFCFFNYRVILGLLDLSAIEILLGLIQRVVISFKRGFNTVFIQTAARLKILHRILIARRLKVLSFRQRLLKILEHFVRFSMV